MGMRTDIKVTYEDYCTLPEGGSRYQLIDGDLVMSPSPTFQHQNIAGRIYSALLQYADAHSAGRVAIAPFDVVLSEVTVLQPDVLYVSKARQSIDKMPASSARPISASKSSRRAIENLTQASSAIFTRATA
jgi:Uma2 family endonuclease